MKPRDLIPAALSTLLLSATACDPAASVDPVQELTDLLVEAEPDANRDDLQEMAALAVAAGVDDLAMSNRPISIAEHTAMTEELQAARRDLQPATHHDVEVEFRAGAQYGTVWGDSGAMSYPCDDPIVTLLMMGLSKAAARGNAKSKCGRGRRAVARGSGMITHPPVAYECAVRYQGWFDCM